MIRARDVSMIGTVLSVVLGLGSGCLAVELVPRDESGTGASSDDAGSAGSTEGAGSSDAGSGDSSDDGNTTGDDTYDGVTCDQDLCLNPEVCCASMAASGCKDTCAGTEVSLVCDGPEDCAGGVCCWGLTGGSSCAATPTDCPSSQPSVACHDPDDCGGDPCEPHVFVNWISICG